MEITKNLKWRYATKKFDASLKISNDNIEQLKEAVQLSVSSFGLQLYKVLIIENPEIREQLKKVSWDQPQITDASHLFLFCNYKSYNDQDVDNYVELTAKTQGTDLSQLSGMSDYLKGSLKNLSPEVFANWTAKQTYIALGNLVAASAELKIDSCPMEGFDSEGYNKILGLTERGLNASVLVALGYRSTEDQAQFRKKVRKPVEVLFEKI